MGARTARLTLVAVILALVSALCVQAQIRPQVTPKPKKPAPAVPAKPPEAAKPEEPEPVKPAAPKAEEPEKRAAHEPQKALEPSQVVIEAASGAEIYLDDQFVGRVGAGGRLVIGDLEPGPHSLRVSLPGKREFSVELERYIVSPLWS